MSQLSETVKFLSLPYLKNSLSITSTDKDSKLLEIILDANNEMDKILSPYIDTPISPGDDLFIKTTLLATVYARARWYRDTGQLDRAEASHEEYESKKESYKELLISKRTNRTETVFVTDKDPLDRLYQPYNTDEYLTRIF